MDIHPEIKWRKLSPSDGHYFFGYYDRTAWNKDSSLHLALKVTQAERLPQTGERAEVGALDRDGNFHSLASTRAWCHQQGAMTLWVKHRPDCFIYNDWDEKERKLIAHICSMKEGMCGVYQCPIYALSLDGNWGATLNFARIPRRGYSYADAILESNYMPDIENDGIFIVNMRSGEKKLAVSYKSMIELHPASYTLEDNYLWLNHIIFNCDSSKLLFLLRHCRDSHSPSPWKTHMYTVNTDGSGLACPLPDFYWKGMISHQIWGRYPHEILIDAKWQDKDSEYVIFDERILPLQAKRISRGMGPMGHLVFSPDAKWMLADTYPVNGVQILSIVDVADGKIREIGRFNHEQPQDYPVDVRCDLHPRWSPDGSLISVDSIHDGQRGIYVCEMPEA